MKLAVIYQPYTQAEVEAERCLVERLLWRLLARVPVVSRWMAHRRMFIEFLANPRPASYMLAHANDTLPKALPGDDSQLFVRGALPNCETGIALLDDAQILPDELGAWERDLTQRLKAGGYKRAVLLFPDAIGLGWRTTEAAVAKAGIRAVWVLNGRRRMLLINGETRRALALRRWLSRSRLAEAAFALAAFPVGAWYALLDRRTAQAMTEGASRGEH